MNISDIINSMSIDEMKERLTAYMEADKQFAAHPVGVEVRMRPMIQRNGRYAVLLLLSDGTEKEVLFPDRYSRLVYIYTLMHPEGYQRRKLEANGCCVLCQLYSQVYFRDADSLLKSVNRAGFDHFFSQAVAQSRVAIRKANAHADDLVIAGPQQYGGKTLIPFAQHQDQIIIDQTLVSL